MALSALLPALRIGLKAVKDGLIHYYTQPQESIFKRLRNSFVGFGLGMALIIVTNNQLPPSLLQEILVLCGLIMVSLSFFIAMLSYTRFVISRIVLFFYKP